MPTYEYECRACLLRFEKFQSMSEAPVSVCPECGGSVRRMIGGGTGIIFKGSGFYVTDSKKSASGSAGKKPPAAGSTGKEHPASDASGAGAASASPGTDKASSGSAESSKPSSSQKDRPASKESA